MSNQFPSCSGLITEDVGGVLHCSTGWEFSQIDSDLGQLTSSEIGLLSASVVMLFATAFVFRYLRGFIDSSHAGRNG